MGWGIEDEVLEASAGSTRAMLIPRRFGGFTALIDPNPTPAELRQGLSKEWIRRGRIAHELAHTFFYKHGAPPRRRFRVVPAEEHFCDAFAEAVMWSRRASRSTRQTA